jgi:glyoxylase-like metal-dependent hydrolase (beta-lactamase superfamily II)
MIWRMILPQGSSAEVRVLFEGYVRDRTAATVSLITDGDVRAVVDPGMVPEPASILDPLRAAGLGPQDVTDVVLSHHHPDHTVNAGLFPGARVHDHWAWYRGDRWVSRPAEGFELSPSTTLVETPGHSPQCITTLAGTADGVVAVTHLWWFATGPPEDPYAPDPQVLYDNRRRVLEVASLVVPGHGPAFRPDDATPR